MGVRPNATASTYIPGLPALDSPLARYYSDAHSFPDYGPPDDMSSKNTQARMRRINGTSGPQNTMNRERGRDAQKHEPANKRQKRDAEAHDSPFFTTAKSTPNPELQNLKRPGSHDVFDLRSTSSAGQTTTAATAIAEYRRTNEQNAVCHKRPRRRGRSRSVVPGSNRERGCNPSPSSSSHAPTDDASVTSESQSPARTSPDILNDPPPVNGSSRASKLFIKKRPPVQAENRYKILKAHEDEIDELILDNVVNTRQTPTSRTNFSGIQSRQSHQFRSRGDIASTNFQSAHPIDNGKRVYIQRAASDRFTYVKYDERKHTVSLYLGSKVAQVKVEPAHGTVINLKWLGIDKATVKSVEHSATHSPIVVVRRARKDDARDDLFIEMRGKEDALDLVEWLGKDCDQKELEASKLSAIINKRIQSIEGYAKSNPVKEVQEHLSPVQDQEARSTPGTIRDPFKGEEATPRSPKLKGRMTNSSGKKNAAESAFRGRGKGGNHSQDDDVEQDAHMSLDSFAPEVQDSGRSSLPRVLRQSTPDRWTVQNPNWGKGWRGSLVFPATGRNRATVDKDDIPRLDEGEFLNDNVINFYFRYLQARLESERPELLKKVHFFSTFFFEKLRFRNKNNYDGVKAWTSKIDLFSYDYVIVPVNEHAHWYLVIICNMPRLLQQDNSGGPPNNVAPETADTTSGTKASSQASPVTTDLAFASLDDKTTNPGLESSLAHPSAQTSEEASAKARNKKSVLGSAQKVDPKDPRIITLDSLGTPHPSTCRYLREYLVEEARHKKGVELKVLPGGITAKNIPEQDNYCDCGVFILGYMEEFLKDPDEAARKLLRKEHSNWNVQPSKLRTSVRELLFRLQEEQQQRHRAERLEKRLVRQTATKANAPTSPPAPPAPPAPTTPTAPTTSGASKAPAAPAAPLRSRPPEKPVSSVPLSLPPKTLNMQSGSRQSSPPSNVVKQEALLESSRGGGFSAPPPPSPSIKKPSSPARTIDGWRKFVSPLSESVGPDEESYGEVFHSARASPMRDSDPLDQVDVKIPVDLTVDNNVSSPFTRRFVPPLSSSPHRPYLAPRKVSNADSTFPDVSRANGFKRPPSRTDSQRPRKTAMVSIVESPIMDSVEREGPSNGAAYDRIDRTIDLTSCN